MGIVSNRVKSFTGVVAILGALLSKTGVFIKDGPGFSIPAGSLESTFTFYGPLVVGAAAAIPQIRLPAEKALVMVTLLLLAFDGIVVKGKRGGSVEAFLESWIPLIAFFLHLL